MNTGKQNRTPRDHRPSKKSHVSGAGCDVDATIWQSIGPNQFAPKTPGVSMILRKKRVSYSIAQSRRRTEGHAGKEAAGGSCTRLRTRQSQADQHSSSILVDIPSGELEREFHTKRLTALLPDGSGVVQTILCHSIDSVDGCRGLEAVRVYDTKLSGTSRIWSNNWGGRS